MYICSHSLPPQKSHILLFNSHISKFYALMVLFTIKSCVSIWICVCKYLINVYFSSPTAGFTRIYFFVHYCFPNI